jgi:hypothetical protein
MSINVARCWEFNILDFGTVLVSSNNGDCKIIRMSIFHIINFKKKFMDTGVLDFFNKKLILDYYFCLKSGPVFLFQILKDYTGCSFLFHQFYRKQIIVQEIKLSE